MKRRWFSPVRDALMKIARTDWSVSGQRLSAHRRTAAGAYALHAEFRAGM
ncbi:MAG TPA: hypothetical protein PK764_02385 [Deltaproteobacteria bacterium]|nr:hypothetical protein [Deltaproteobacteria bacterium]